MAWSHWPSRLQPNDISLRHHGNFFFRYTLYPAFSRETCKLKVLRSLLSSTSDSHLSAQFSTQDRALSSHQIEENQSTKYFVPLRKNRTHNRLVYTFSATAPGRLLCNYKIIAKLWTTSNSLITIEFLKDNIIEGDTKQMQKGLEYILLWRVNRFIHSKWKYT